jgi:adenylate cyclase, class 2
VSATAAGTQEIEVKYRVSDPDELEKALADVGAVLSGPVSQDDQAYAPAGWEYGEPKTGVTFARLRTSGGGHLFTVKQPVDNEMACLEHETAVTDRGQMHDALILMGFRPTVRIVKTRRTATLGGMRLCVDEVEDAGVFLEIERVSPTGRNGLEAQAELDRFAQGLRVELDRVTDTYDSLVRAAQGLPG